MNKEISNENKKNIPKFLKMILICGIAGGIIGFFVGFSSDVLGETVATENFIQALHEGLGKAIPYLFVIFIIFFAILDLKMYKGAKSLYSKWDGEDEDVIDKVEEKLSYFISLSAIQMTLGFFLFGAYQITSKYDSIIDFIPIVAFLINMAIVIIAQQKAIDFEKVINPEKKGSVYDPKFKDKWLASCDENEIRQIGQASYKAFVAVNVTCIILWVVLFFASYFLDIGLLPLVIVTVIEIVAQVSYLIEGIKLARHK